VALDDSDIAVFEDAVREIAKRLGKDRSSAEELFGAAFRELGESRLPVDEVARRARRLLESVPQDEELLLVAARVARTSVAAIRGAVVGLLPAELQRQAYDEGTDLGSSARQGEAFRAPADEAQPRVSVDEPNDWHTVFLLGDRTESDRTNHFLSSRGYKGVRVANTEQLDALATESCAGMVMHASWWRELPNGEAAAAFLDRQLGTSSVLFYRVDSDGLESPEQLAEVLDRFDASTQARVQISSGATLTEFDVAQLDKVASLLETADQAAISIEGISDSERRLMSAAAALFEAEDRGSANMSHDRVKLVVRPIVEGKSTARVVKLRVEGQRSVLVAKLDERSRLQLELERARRVMPAGQAVQMKLYSLGGDSVLIQQLTGDLDDPLQGAPSLKERLNTRSAWERGRRRDPEPRLSDLDVGITRLVANVKSVNTASATGDDRSCWLGVEPLAALQELGLHWQIESDAGMFDPMDVLEWVSAKVAARGEACLVHGDLHSGNVLLMDDRTPKLIDFASAGAGHPCFDLVRLGSSIVYSSLRPVVPEAALRGFFADVHVSGASIETLRANHSELGFETGARTAATALVNAREAAFSLLGSHGGAEADYLAMVYLVAAQSLTMSEFQNSVIRAALGAIYPTISALAAASS
jgi:hypothetical protein